jgi:flagellar hook protein FlgE
MMRSLFSGVSGLQEHQTMMDVVGNNIANVNTIGFKSGSVTLEDMISQTESGGSAPLDGFGGVNPTQIGLGVVGGTINTLFTQGNLETTGKTTDLALQGNGFFILKQGNDQQQYYTRNGSFDVDSDNNLVNPSDGMKVQGWMANPDGTVTTTTPVTDLKVPLGELMTSHPTDTAAYIGNLDAAAAADPTSDYSSSIQVFDSLGDSTLVNLTFEKSAANTWNWTASGTGITAGPANQGTVTFDNNGNFLNQTGNVEIDVSANGATSPLDVTMDFTGTTQFGTATTITAGNQNGYAPGVMDSYNIGQDGVITGVYSNGSTRAVGQIAIAAFRNPGGLLKTGDSDYVQSSNSGIPQVGTAMSSSRGSVVSGELEMSNVDLSKEFTTMIIAERGFQANSKIIQTADEMLTTLVGLIR